MLLPRPEMRTATRFESRMVGRESSCGANAAAAQARLDAADVEYRLARGFERVSNTVRLAAADDGDHSDPAVEGAHHFLGRDLPAGAEFGEDRGQGPPIGVYHRM